ncbi:MAG: DNA recombination protein RmuC [Micavibrio sp.]|nr:DNA recombination protein RmuC [Micavibrio sp.]|tara:strand:+ start:151918 stop:153186 length:1269 start_codon:yes stop_codon:yes gene_type:complete
MTQWGMSSFLQNLNIDGTSLLIGVFAGIVIASLFFIGRLIRAEREKARLENMAQTFDSLAQESLKKSTEQFMQLAELRLKNVHDEGAHELEKRKEAISKLIEPVTQTLTNMDEKLKDLEKVRLNAYAELRTQMEGMTRDQATLRQETSSLVQALRSPSARGQWGEMQLKRCLEMAGMVEGVHFETQVTGEGMRPDAIINLPGNKQVIIDAKAPIDAYLNAFKEDISEEARMSALDAHAKHVKAHMKSLGQKSYWSQFESPEFVIMFLPGESYFSAALERDPGLIEAGVNERVIPASPTTLISLCKAVMYGWSQEKLAESAREVSELGSELYKRVSVFGRHMQDMGKGLERALSSYNKAVGSLESNVLPQARRFNDFHIGQSQDLPDLTAVESATRSLSAPELTEHGDDKEATENFDKKKASG